MDCEGLTDYVTGTLTGVKRAIGVLKDKLHFLAKGAYLLLWPGRDILPFEDNLSCCGTIETKDTAGHSGFAAAALTDESQCFASLYSKTHIIHGLYVGYHLFKEALCDREVHFQVFDL
jgi:hypothetical protein